MQEQRDVRDLNMLQDQADLLKAQQIYSTQSAMSSLGTAAETLAGGIVPKQLPETNFTEGADGPPTEEDFFNQNLSDSNNPFSFMQQDIDNFQSTNSQLSQGLIASQQSTQRRSDPRVPGASYLSQFYSGVGESLPSVSERAPLYERLGLGSANSYIGSREQNRAFLKELQYANY